MEMVMSRVFSIVWWSYRSPPLLDSSPVSVVRGVLLIAGMTMALEGRIRG